MASVLGGGFLALNGLSTRAHTWILLASSLTAVTSPSRLLSVHHVSRELQEIGGRAMFRRWQMTIARLVRSLLKLWARFASCCLVLSLAASIPTSASAIESQVWMAPPFEMEPGADGKIWGEEYLRMFVPEPSWEAVAARVQVFKLYTGFSSRARDSQLRAVIGFVRAHNMKLAIEAGTLMTPTTCGQGVEGYSGEHLMNIARRIKKLGGRLDYLALDEPLYYAHAYKGPKACHTPIAEVAAGLLENIRQLKEEFPGICVGDVEPEANNFSPQTWDSEVAQWIPAFRTATGEDLAFVHFDVNWSGPWNRNLAALRKVTRAANIPFGVIFNSAPEDESDESYAGNVEDHYTDYEAFAGGPPDHPVFQSWEHVHPTMALPPSSPTSFTGIFARYFRERVVITGSLDVTTIKGTLARATGQPLANASLVLQYLGVGAEFPLAPHTIAGTVPAEARSALFAVRMNAECGCSGPVSVHIGAVRYSESEGAAKLVFAPEQHDWWIENPASGRVASGGRQGPRIEISLPPGQAFRLNSRKFAVTPGAPFSASVAVAGEEKSIQSGYLALVFFNGEGNEVKRIKQAPPATWQGVGQASTAADGNFSLTLPHGISPVNGSLRLRFPGNDQLRPAWLRIDSAKP